MRLNQVTVGCLDYAASVAFYQALGLRLIVDAPPRYARFETATGETFSVHEVNEVSSSTTVVYFETETLDETVEALKGAGLTFTCDPVDQSWGWREARLQDPAGNEICLFWGGENRRFPPWRVDGARTHDARE
ncbi:MAG: VOC family protein [Erythrobacter sp.]|uniref:VOC family protein n=1 Tax=Erythrobacter sp. TaxID=1042 RepID=UPI0026362E44|nr:VOC family protein [Erythrobacter sp.]MDJ0977671.1 VOC family protein [Erythrobacter sp.]